MTPDAGIGVVDNVVLRLLPALLATCLKASIVLACVYGVTKAFKQMHPRSRHLLWMTAISSYLLVFALSILGPGVRLGAARVPFERVEMYSNPTSAGSFSPAAPDPEAAPNDAAAGRAETPDPVGSAGGGVPGYREPRYSVPPESGQTAPIWPLIALLFWIEGALISYSKVALGRARFTRLAEKTRVPGPPGGECLLRRLLSDSRVTKKVSLVTSEAVTIPFTCRILRPLIVLPKKVGRWPEGRLRAVLLHELAHVRRHDLLTQAAALAICSLFWFVPFVWAAYSHLYLEQEKACDARVVDDGVEKTEYADCLLDAARLAARPFAETVPFTGLFFAGGRKRALEERIINVVEGRASAKKGRPAALVTALVACALVFLSGASGRRTIPTEAAYAKLVGEWVNYEYGDYVNFQKIVFKPGFVQEERINASDTHPWGIWTIEPKAAWVDLEANTYCQIYCFCTDGYDRRCACVVLVKLDRHGEVLEMTMRSAIDQGSKYPPRIDPPIRSTLEGWYFVYRRGGGFDNGVRETAGLPNKPLGSPTLAWPQ